MLFIAFRLLQSRDGVDTKVIWLRSAIEPVDLYLSAHFGQEVTLLQVVDKTDVHLPDRSRQLNVQSLH